MDDSQLQQIEEAAAEIAMGAGALLLRYFKGPLDVAYKANDKRNPVTDADHASDEYIRGEIARRFPDHGIVSEEMEAAPEDAPDIAWIIDPLDGTTNFLHGVPVFGACIGVLERGAPVAAAIFTPSIHAPEGSVIHGRRGGGAFEADRRLTISNDASPTEDRLMGFLPTYFLRMFDFRKQVRRRLGDIRSSGSTAYESALAARGSVDYVVFSGPYLWDVAPGVLLVQEAGGAVWGKAVRAQTWQPFDRFAGADNAAPSLRELRDWRGALILGAPTAAQFIADGTRHRPYRMRRLLRRARTALRPSRS